MAEALLLGTCGAHRRSGWSCKTLCLGCLGRQRARVGSHRVNAFGVAALSRAFRWRFHAPSVFVISTRKSIMTRIFFGRNLVGA